MKLSDFVYIQFETFDSLILKKLYELGIAEIYDEKIYPNGLESFKHSIRGIINKMVKEKKIIRTGPAKYKKINKEIL